MTVPPTKVQGRITTVEWVYMSVISVSIYKHELFCLNAFELTANTYHGFYKSQNSLYLNKVPQYEQLESKCL